MAYGDLKDVDRITATDKVFCDKAFHIAKNSKYDGYHRGPASMVCNFFVIKNFSGGTVKNEIISNK